MDERGGGKEKEGNLVRGEGERVKGAGRRKGG